MAMPATTKEQNHYRPGYRKKVGVHYIKLAEDHKPEHEDQQSVADGKRQP